ncbi:peptide ABC transporter substrate-binding protein [Oceanirhabdus seepicola]|uniref:Peptide ABC transporter substrate-binding protein n=1 Tax=Oceanirhabdus seepicola TaxID=2828781 RepID=A0A9J6P766_9CLOT|nr:peptide ABC transporter substrate-binding protein [Oceanirhabdus seepicola]MCM1992451.1 peptide ABC transporter substrate-binding protein [Oceanirhabdus seepicola]
MKSKKLIALTVAATMVIGGMFTSCGNKNDNAKGNGETKNNQAAKDKDNQGDKAEGENLDKEQYMNVFLDHEPKSLDPSRSSDMYSNQILTHIVDGLTRIEQDENGDKIVPGIAESWDVSDDGLVWTFHLRDAKWSDGEKVTAEQFEYGLKRTLNPDTGSKYAWIITPVIKNAAAFNTGECTAEEVGVKVIDEKTIQYTLEIPAPYFLDLTYFRVLFPQRKDMVEKYGEGYGSEAEHMISNGAFTLESWIHDSEVTFKKNPEYWNAEEVILDKINMSIISDRSSRYNTLLTGDIDLGPVAAPEWIEKFNAMDDMVYNESVKPSTSFQFFNQNGRYFKNDKIRKAFIIAYNREKYIDVQLNGMAMPAYAWIPPTVQISGVDFRDKANSAPVQRLIDENPDPKALLIEGLKELGESENPSDMTIRFLKGSTTARSKQAAELEQQMFQNTLGVNLEIDFMDWAIFQEKTDNMEYELAGMMWTGDYNDPNTFLEMFTSAAAMTPTGWVNKEYDKLIADAAKTIDQEERLKMFKRAEEILIYEDANICPTNYDIEPTFTRTYVKGYMKPLFGGMDLTKAYTVGRK